MTHQYMPTQIRDDRPVANIHHNQDLRPVHDPGPTAQRGQDSMVQLMRHGLDTLLKSVQVWADLARQLGPTTLDSPGGATMVSVAHDPFEKLLAAQRKVVDELVATQRQLMQRFLDPHTATVSDDLAAR